MPKKPKPEPDDKEQSARFIETAKQLQADKSSKVFEDALTIIKYPKNQASKAKANS